MKKIALVVAFLFASISAFAADTISGTGTQATNVNSGSTAGANNAGNAQSITFNQEATKIPTDTTQHVEYSGSQTVRNVPSVSGPPLTTSNDTCMGSSSGSANVPGFGVSVGSTWTDANCKLLKNSRELWNMGMKAASLALMCNDADNKHALEITGYHCPTESSNKTAALKGSPAAAGGPDMSDPYIAARVAANSR